MVEARRLIDRDLLMEEGLRHTALDRPTVAAHRLIDPHRLTVAVLRLTDPHRPTEVVARIVVAEAARLSPTVAAVEVEIAAGIAAAVVDVLPPGDTEAVANQFLDR
jgi:hypothetical protein